MGLRVRITTHNDDVDPTSARSLARVNVVRADVRELRNMPTHRTASTPTPTPTPPDHGDSGMTLLTTLVDAGDPAS